jgi:hypothetical protein
MKFLVVTLALTSVSFSNVTAMKAPIHAITFKGTSNDVQPTKFRGIAHGHVKGGDTLPKIMKESKTLDRAFDTIVQTSTIPKTTLICPARQGLVSTIVRAYNTHHNLILRPDDIWQAILTQFSFYVNANGEALRDKFVDFDGKKKLIICMGGTLFTADFGTFAKRMVDEQICTNIKDPEVTQWLLPNFTTTINDDRIAAAVSIMSTLQNYFEYKCVLFCGIPNVTLLGTVDDWKLLREKVDGLLKYDVEGKEPIMQKWHGLLSKVVDEFVKSAEGKPSLKFWDTVAHRIGGGSGPSYLSGWVTAFACFKADGEWQGNSYEKEDWPRIDTTDIAEGVVSVPVELDDNGAQYEANMIAGQIVFSVIGEGLDTVQPRNDWCFAIKGEKQIE